MREQACHANIVGGWIGTRFDISEVTSMLDELMDSDAFVLFACGCVKHR